MADKIQCTKHESQIKCIIASDIGRMFTHKKGTLRKTETNDIGVAASMPTDNGFKGKYTTCAVLQARARHTYTQTLPKLNEKVLYSTH